MAQGEISPQVRETGKSRSQRIQIDYFRRRGGLYYLKWWLSILALLASGLYAFYVIQWPGAVVHVSTGPLALAHASFENDCSKCHEDFSPIASDAMKFNPIAKLSHIETACQSCHRVDDHYREFLTADWKTVDQNCALCHRDHQGRDHDLSSVDNAACTACHAKLNEVCSSNHQPRVTKVVTQFTKADHGDFASLVQGDPGKIKFDHAQHLVPGQVDANRKGGLTIAMLEPSKREQYRREGQADDSLVELDCASCHEFDGNPDRNLALAGDSELGRYMAPIRFDEHCSACHSMNPNGRSDDTLPLPHAAPWAEIALLLESKINGELLRGNRRSTGDDSQSVPRPGEGLGTSPAAPRLASASTVDQAVTMVRQQCLKCHDEDSITDASIATLTSSSSPSLIPTRWLQRGLYDHAAHRKVDCRYCHAAAYAGSAESAPNPDQNVMIAGIDSCTGCHRNLDQPVSDESAALWGDQPTWAADDCVLCHRYHAKRPESSEAAP